MFHSCMEDLVGIWRLGQFRPTSNSNAMVILNRTLYMSKNAKVKLGKPYNYTEEVYKWLI